MSEISDMLVDGIRAMQDLQVNDAGAAPLLNWNAADYPCCQGAATVGRTLGIGGFTVDLDLVLVIVLADFPKGPPSSKRDKVYFPGPGAGGTRYRIDQTITPPQGGIMVLGLINDTKGI